MPVPIILYVWYLRGTTTSTSLTVRATLLSPESVSPLSLIILAELQTMHGNRVMVWMLRNLHSAPNGTPI